KSNIADFLCENTGGPCSYVGRTMKESHKGLALTKEDFDACNAALDKALDSSKVAAPDKAEVMKLGQSLMPDIVGRYMSAPHRRARYWNRERETMPPGARERYQTGWLSALLEHAWAHAPGVRRRLEQAGLAPKDFRSTDDLARLPVIRKNAMPELQKADPPFG